MCCLTQCRVGTDGFNVAKASVDGAHAGWKRVPNLIINKRMSAFDLESYYRSYACLLVLDRLFEAKNRLQYHSNAEYQNIRM